MASDFIGINGVSFQMAASKWKDETEYTCNYQRGVPQQPLGNI